MAASSSTRRDRLIQPASGANGREVDPAEASRQQAAVVLEVRVVNPFKCIAAILEVAKRHDEKSTRDQRFEGRDQVEPAREKLEYMSAPAESASHNCEQWLASGSRQSAWHSSQISAEKSDVSPATCTMGRGSENGM